MPTPEEIQQAVRGFREPSFQHLVDDLTKAFPTIAQDVDLAVRVYAALCNMRWQHKTYDPNHEEPWVSCTWRYAGGLVASLRGLGEGYMHFYCSGGEGQVAEDVRDALAQLGWTPIPY